MSSSAHQPTSLEVTLPGGGHLQLFTLQEVAVWEETKQRYIDDYGPFQQNDLVLLGAILSQNLAMFRAQQRMNGMQVERDANGIPTGKYVMSEPKPAEMSSAQGTITKAAAEIRELEKALGIDKKSRESSGDITVKQYVTDLKAAARDYGVHISRRTLAFEKFAMEMRWRLRMLKNADAEDRSYHKITPQTICDWAHAELHKLEEVDKTYAREKGKVWMGKLR